MVLRKKVLLFSRKTWYSYSIVTKRRKTEDPRAWHNNGLVRVTVHLRFCNAIWCMILSKAEMKIDKESLSSLELRKGTFLTLMDSGLAGRKLLYRPLGCPKILQRIFYLDLLPYVFSQM